MKQKRDAEAQRRYMLETPVSKLVIALGIPAVATQLVSVAYNTADTYFISKISTSASAAVGVVFSLMSIIHALGFGIGMGVSSLVSRRLGAGKKEEASRYTTSGFLAALVMGILIMIFGLIFIEPLMKLLGSTDTMLPYSCDYARWILMGAPVMCTSFVLNQSLKSEGAAMAAMWGICSGSVINIVLDPLLIFTFDMGIAGAALATVASQTASFLILLGYYVFGNRAAKLSPRYISRRAADYLLVFKIGLPTICRQGMASVASALLNIGAAAYGDAAVAAVTISNKIYMFVRSVVIGVGQGFQPVAGFNYGAGVKKRVREGFRFTCIVGTVICLICAGVIASFAGELIGWFRDDPDVIRIGRTALLFACAVMPFMAYSTYVNQLCQCLGFAARAAVLASCRQGICYIPLILILPRVIGLTGVQMSQPGADFLTFVVSVPFQIHFFKTVLSEKNTAPVKAAK